MLRTVITGTAMLVLALVLAACGGSSSPNSTQSGAKAANNVSLKLAECVREHGVPDFPDPSGNGGFQIQSSPNGNAPVSVDGRQINVSAPAFQRAMQDCQKYQPQGPPISGARLAQIKQGALKMARCMREHGIPNFPDPKVSSGPGGRGIQVEIGGPAAEPGSGRLDPSSPAFSQAQKVCQPLMGVGPGPGTKAGS